MPINPVTGPPDGQALAQRELARRIPKGPMIAALAGSPQMGAALPVFHLELGQLKAASPLERAVLIGWRFPIIGGFEPGLADVRESASLKGALVYGGLQQGLYPRRLLQASQLAESMLAADPQSFEPRMLQVPALQFSALWLRGTNDRDLFVSLLEGRPPGSAPLHMVSDILTPLRIRAEARSPSGGGPTPTN